MSNNYNYLISVLSLTSLSFLINIKPIQAETIKAVNSKITPEVVDLNSNLVSTSQNKILNDSSQENLNRENAEIMQSAQAQRRSENRRNREIPTAPNYIGIGGSLGLIEDVYGDFGAFAVNSKFKLFSIIDAGSQGVTEVSFRPSMIVGKEVSFAVPATIDFRLPGFKEKMSAFVPYIGPGFTISTDNDVFYFLLSGGVDIPIGDFTVNSQLNLAFEDDTALGLTLAIGYNF
jgi:hypothetical protein